MADDVGDWFSAFCRRLATLFADLTAARRRGICTAMNESIASVQETLADFEAELAEFSPHIGPLCIIVFWF